MSKKTEKDEKIVELEKEIDELNEKVDKLAKILARRRRRNLGGRRDEVEEKYFTVDKIFKRVQAKRNARKEKVDK